MPKGQAAVAMGRAAGGEDLGATADHLVALAEQPSGRLPDDVVVVLCRGQAEAPRAAACAARRPWWQRWMWPS